MALIKNSKGRKDPEQSGYYRIFGNLELGSLMSKIHSAVISSGNELEKIVEKLSHNIEDIDSFLKSSLNKEGVYLVKKNVIKKSILKSNKEPDFLIFKIDGNKKHCYIVELKDGDAFDTKKSQGEKDLLISFSNHIANKIPFTCSIHICFFNSSNRESIVKGFKNKITTEEALTGRELCSLLNIDFDEIVESRKTDQKENFNYFLDELLKIKEVLQYVKEKLE